MSTTPSRAWPFVVLGIGLLAISFGAVLARYAQAAQIPSLAVAAWRLGLAALVVTPVVGWFCWRHGLASLRLSRRQLGGALVAGLCLAAHFGTWITSLEYTSVASSSALVTTNPLWIGLASFLLFREVPNRHLLAGIGLSLLGSLLIFLSDGQQASAGSQPLLGNGLALVGSWFFSAYLMIGRRLRVGLTLTLYIWLAYGIAALFLFGATAATAQPMAGFSLLGWLALLGMALGPQLVGHTSYNWALKHVSPSFVAVVTLGEPVGCALLAYVFFQETLAPLQSVGFALLLVGIYLAAQSERGAQP
ncbi:DMT family transporter [Macromonas nakdongensis]|uniref:DMT family transporter n=1 Tax=Macromonas nakdongensis TaxID=1843082 RepID=UPI000C320A36|nr:DMT family transporter [Macromonas nakdongensis]